MKITADVDCNNAPKKKYILDFNIYLVEGNIDALSEMLTDDFEWVIVGKSTFSGKESLAEVLKNINPNNVSELVVENDLSHGKLCSINGKIIAGSGQIAFNDSFEFEGHSKQAKIKKIVSYRISEN